MSELVGLPSEWTEPALAAAFDLALRRLVESNLTERDWVLFEGRVEGIDYVATCLNANGRGVHASIAAMNERRRVIELLGQSNRNEIIQSIRREVGYRVAST